MQDGRILNHQVTASSEGWWLDLSTFKARNARLWLKSTSWVGSVLDSNPWIQISFAPEIKLITGISTQGNPSHDWFTSSYTLKYGMTGKTWHDYEREGFVEVQSLKWKDIFIYLKRDTVQAEISCFHDYGQELAVSLLCCLEILRNRRQK